MRHLLTMALAATISLGMIGASTQTADAGKRGRIVAGILLGAAAVGIATHYKRRHYNKRYRYSSRRYVPRKRYYRTHRVRRIGNAHVSWCYNRYRSYRSWDNTFQPYHGGRRACYSPYS